MKRRLATALIVLAAGAATAWTDTRADVVVLPEDAPWRTYLVTAPQVRGTAANPQPVRRGKIREPSPLPPADWMQPDFDAHAWARLTDDLDAFTGEYGYRQPADMAMLCLRSRFGITDPARATDLTLEMEYRGGVIVYVNGREVGRQHMPEGPVEPLTLAEDYPLETYLLPGGGGSLRRTSRPAEEHLERYEMRIRHLKMRLPADALRRGANVLALELHRAAFRGSRDEWSTVGVCKVGLTSRSGAGAVAYDEAAGGLQLWNALALETVAERPKPLNRGWGTGPMSISATGMRRGNPFDPLRPIRMLGPRGGVASGQVVLSCDAPVGDLKATLGPLAHAKGDVIPAGDIEVRYAAQREDERFCDALLAEPPDGATVVPVWIVAKVPAGRRPGWYTGELTLEARGRTFRVPVQLFASAFTVPEPRDDRALVALPHSPDTLAIHYGVDPLSEPHWRLLDESFKLLGQLGQDELYVPVIHKTHMGHETGFVRWVERGGGYEPEFSALERLMDLYEKHCGQPKVVCLIVWKPQYGSKANFRGAQVKGPEPIVVTRFDPRTGQMEPMEAPMFGSPGSEAFWRTMIDGVRDRVRKRGWDERALMLGQGFDSRPLAEHVEFLGRVAPGLRWQVFSHWIRDPRPENGRLVLANGMVVGFREQAGPTPLPVLDDDYPDVPERDFLMAGSHRMDVVQWSSPPSWRNIPTMTGTLCRIPFDFWPTRERDGRLRPLLHTGICGAWLYRAGPRAIVSPGPSGPAPTVRFQMVREALAETEARIALSEALHKLPEGDRKGALQALLAERRMARHVGRAVPQAQVGLDWLGLSAREFAAAAALAGETENGAWSDPPDTAAGAAGE